jgi:hypothetical protein
MHHVMPVYIIDTSTTWYHPSERVIEVVSILIVHTYKGTHNYVMYD